MRINAKELFGNYDKILTGKCAKSRKMANHTYIVRRGENIAVLLHATDVVTITPKGETTLNSGGWMTAVTKERMDTYGPYSIYQDKGKWQVYTPKGAFQFRDGMKIKVSGVCDASKWTDAAGKKAVSYSKKVNAFAKEIVRRAFSLELPAPSGGDCWYCCMVTKDGKAMGDAFTNNEHIANHISEGYYVPSMFWNAMMEEKGCLSQIAEGNLGILQQKLQDKDYPQEFVMLGVIKEQCYKAMRKYLRKRLKLSI